MSVLSLSLEPIILPGASSLGHGNPSAATLHFLPAVNPFGFKSNERYVERFQEVLVTYLRIFNTDKMNRDIRPLKDDELLAIIEDESYWEDFGADDSPSEIIPEANDRMNVAEEIFESGDARDPEESGQEEFSEHCTDSEGE
nr:unnamed protein product [Callosobruchus analis]